MRRLKRVLHRAETRRRGRRERGVALITTLLLLMLLTGLSVVMVWSLRSDMLINGYYRNFRGSFYAADSGLNIARQAMINQIVASIPATFTATKQPIAPGTELAVQTYMSKTYGTLQNITGTGSASNSWPEKFRISSVTLAPSLPVGCTVSGGTGTCAAPVGPITSYNYSYDYTLAAVGQSRGAEETNIIDRGTIFVVANLIPASSKTSFAAWGMFIDQSPICNGSTLVPGTISGPVFTNGAWNFGTSGPYIFTDSVGSASATAGYQISARQCDQVAGPSDTSKNGNTTIAPSFQGGLNLGQSSVPLPPNDFNQERAVLDGKGADNTQVTPADLHNSVRDINGNPYQNSSTKSPGVYLPYTIQDGKPTFTGGGLLVVGDANIRLSTAGVSGQVYTITQGTGTSAVTTTITVDPSANGGKGATTMVSGGTTLTITGIPEQLDPATGAVQGPATMLYVDGNINSLSGPGEGLPAVQDGSALTITAANNVTVTGDILYKTKPIATPSDTLIPGADNGQALGIFTAKGDVQLNNQQADGNIEIDASLATISQTGTGGLTNIGNKINTLTIVGGRIQNQIKNINTVTRNVYFDRRFGSGFAPPWFPSTTVALGGITSANVTTSVSRKQWVNTSSY